MWKISLFQWRCCYLQRVNTSHWLLPLFLCNFLMKNTSCLFSSLTYFLKFLCHILEKLYWEQLTYVYSSYYFTHHNLCFSTTTKNECMLRKCLLSVSNGAAANWELRGAGWWPMNWQPVLENQLPVSSVGHCRVCPTEHTQPTNSHIPVTVNEWSRCWNDRESVHIVHVKYDKKMNWINKWRIYETIIVDLMCLMCFSYLS